MAFVAVQTIAWARGLDISCGCFGATGSEKIGLTTIGLGIALAFSSWTGYWALGK
ncbi:MAG: hypothetical protein HY288_15575 [Planctomycetia bacterium]|nr:hypothetical protein [Planctomycetia bacterium]